MEIPSYPDSRPLALDDKPFLDDLFSILQPRISEFTFANLFLFRNAHYYRLTRVGKTLVILARGYGGEPYFLLPPVDDIEDALGMLLDDGLTLYGADEGFKERFFQEGTIEVVEDRNSFDYLYSRREMAELPGNRFHKKKNRINYFSGRHNFAVEIFTERHIVGCIELLNEWRRVHEELDVSESARLEAEASAASLEMSASLELEGVVAIVEGRIRAFALGEKLNANTSVCHFEKADPFLEGLYQVIDREFNRLLFTDCEFVNKEQDLGIANLRGSKLSYHPVELVKKYRARRISGGRA